MDWKSIVNDLCEQPASSALLGLYYNFMNIKRYEHMPFYIYPSAKSWISFEDTILTFIDWFVDAHELERNTGDKGRSFYQRSSYVLDNYLRYQNDTLANVMYDTKARKLEYDRLNSVAAVGNTRFYLATSAVHTLGFMYMAYFFRFRRVGLVPAFVIASGYYYAFSKINNAAYKWFVDRPVIETARDLGLGAHVQPVGHFKNRGHNFK
jgi:hypothetical protein